MDAALKKSLAEWATRCPVTMGPGSWDDLIASLDEHLNKDEDFSDEPIEWKPAPTLLPASVRAVGDPLGAYQPDWAADTCNLAITYHGELALTLGPQARAKGLVRFVASALNLASGFNPSAARVVLEAFEEGRLVSRDYRLRELDIALETAADFKRERTRPPDELVDALTAFFQSYRYHGDDTDGRDALVSMPVEVWRSLCAAYDAAARREASGG